MSNNTNNKELYFTKREWILRYASPFKALSFMAGPMIVIMIVNALYGIIDKQLTINFAVQQVKDMIGSGQYFSPNIGADQMTIEQFAKQIINVSTQYSNTIIMILQALALFTSIGTSIRFSQAMGARDKEKMNEVVITGFFLTLILIVVGTLLLNFTYQYILTTQAGIEHSERFKRMQFVLADEYTKMFVYGFGLLVLTNFFTTLLRTEGKVLVVISISIVAVILNISCGILFMEELGLGMAGAVYGSMVAWVFSIAVALFIIFTSSDTLIKPDFKSYKWNNKSALKIWFVGLSPLLINIIMAVVSFTSTILITHMHTIDIDPSNKEILDQFIIIQSGGPNGEVIEQISSTIRINSSTFPWMSLIYAPIIGASQGANVNYAYSHGAQKRERIAKIFKLHLMISFIWFMFALIMVVSFAGPMMEAFAGPVEKKEWFIYYLAPMPFAAITFTTVSFYQGVGKTNSALIISIGRALVFQIIMLTAGFFIAKSLSADGSKDWVFFLMNGLLEVPAAVLAGWFVIRLYRKYNSTGMIVDLPDNFEAPSWIETNEKEFLAKKNKQIKLLEAKMNKKVLNSKTDEQKKEIEEIYNKKIKKCEMIFDHKEKIFIAKEKIKIGKLEDSKNWSQGKFDINTNLIKALKGYQYLLIEIWKEKNLNNQDSEKIEKFSLKILNKFQKKVKKASDKYTHSFEFFESNKVDIMRKNELKKLTEEEKNKKKLVKIELAKQNMNNKVKKSK